MLLQRAQVRIEVVVANQKYLAIRIFRIVLGNLMDQLQSHRRFTGSLRPKDDGRRRLLGVSDDLTPRGVERARDAEITEDRIGLRILVDKGIACQSVVFEELLFGHGSRFLVVKIARFLPSSSKKAS